VTWLSDLMRSPEVLMGAVGLLAAVFGLAVRGEKAKFAEEMDKRLDKRFEATAEVALARAEAVDTKIAALQSDMTEVKTDVRNINGKLDKILSNGFFPHE